MKVCENVWKKEKNKRSKQNDIYIHEPKCD